MTAIRFYLPHEDQVNLSIYDMMGREIIRLIDGPMDQGEHQIKWAPSQLQSGVYFYRIQAGEHRLLKK